MRTSPLAWALLMIYASGLLYALVYHLTMPVPWWAFGLFAVGLSLFLMAQPGSP